MPLQNSTLNQIKNYSYNSYIIVMSGKTHLLSRRSMWQDKFFCSHSYLSVFLIWLHTSERKIKYFMGTRNTMKSSSSKYVWSLDLLGNPVCIRSHSCWIQCALIWHLSSRDEIRGHKICLLQFRPICCTCCLTQSTENNTLSLQNPVLYLWTVAQSPWKGNLLQLIPSDFCTFVRNF